MKNCNQYSHQTVYEHGLSVQRTVFKLINLLNTTNTKERNVNEFRLPNWFWDYKNEIKNSLLSKDIILIYTLYHDLGKPYCIQYDEDGKVHFPNHTEMSYKIWNEISDNKIIGELIRRDMEIHTIGADEIENFVKNKEIAITLLLTGLAEIHSNAQMFGGIESINFKIKWKQIDKRGRTICKYLFGEKESEFSKP